MRRFSITILGLLLGLVLAGCGRPQVAPAETGTQTTRRTAVAVPVQPAPGDAAVEQPTPTAVQPSPVPSEEGPTAARVVVGGNVRNRPTTRGSIVLDQVGVGETVLLRMRLANGQWYSIVTPRGTIGWSWVGLLDVDPAVAARVPVGSEDPVVVAPATPTVPPAAEIPTVTVPIMGAEPTTSETAAGNAGGPIMGAEPAATEEPASGSLIAYADEGNIWLLNPATGETRRATTNGDSDEPAWTADGRSLLFVVRGDEDSGIYTMPMGGADTQLLVDGPDPELFPAAALNGDIYYVRHVVRDDGSRWEIVRHGATGEGQVIYSLATGLCAATDLQVSDTRWMLALGCGRGTAVMAGDLAGGEGTDLGQQLGSTGGCLYGGAWSRLVPEELFVLQSHNCDPANASTITSVDMASGTPATEPIYIGQGISAIDTSPDGSELVFARTGQNGTPEGLWLIGIDGQSTPRQIAAAGTRPAWRP